MKRDLTEQERALKNIFRLNYDRKDQARKQAKPAAPKKEHDTNPSSGDHIDPTAPLKGVLAKGDRYPWRGHDYLKKQDGRGVYRNFAHPHLEGIRNEVRQKAEFPGGPEENFNPAFRHRYPYAWRAHHLLPSSAFYYETKDKKPAFTYKQLRLILLSDYNINHGHNIIMLPWSDDSVFIHCLLCHPSNHPDYTLKVMNEMQKVSRELQKVIDSQEPHGSLPEQCFERLKKLEDFFWRFLVVLGKLTVQARAAGRRYTGLGSEHIRYESADGKKQYSYGSLK